MTPSLATGIAEGSEESTSTEYLAAWQYLVDTGLAQKLDGWISDTAQALIDRGIIKPKTIHI